MGPRKMFKYQGWRSKNKTPEIAEMLAPAAITLRRPSGEVDLILSKKDFLVCRRYDAKNKHVPGMYSPPHRSCQSENTSPVGSSLPSPTDSAAGSTSSLHYSPDGASPHSSPHGHRKSWFHKVVQLKEDADKINKRMKHSKSSRLRDSVECLKSKLSGKKETCDPTKRTLRVEKISSARKSKRGSKDDTCILSYDQPDHNFTTSLLMTNLEEGYFSAELSLDNLPIGNITIRIRDYKLEIVVDRHHGRDKSDGSHKMSTPYYCGSIAIPIYVMPQSLEVSLNEERNVLEMRGMTKGYQYQRMSSSTHDLRSKSSPTTEKRRFKKMPAGLFRIFSSGKDADVANGMSSLNVSDDGQRDRAYTR